MESELHLAMRKPSKILRRSAGFSLVEVMFALTILTISAVGVSGYFTAVPRLLDAAQRQRIVMDETLGIYEELRGEDFETIFVRYNDSTTDDPAGANSPGNTRTLDESSRVLGDGSAIPATITLDFPTPTGNPGLLREDQVDPSLGLPRDLNGDGVIDSSNHASDYVVLPVRINVSWFDAGQRKTRSETVVLSGGWQ